MADPMDEILAEAMVTMAESRASEVCRVTITTEAARALLQASYDPADLARRYLEVCRLREHPYLVVRLGGAAVIADWDFRHDCLKVWDGNEERR